MYLYVYSIGALRHSQLGYAELVSYLATRFVPGGTSFKAVFPEVADNFSPSKSERGQHHANMSV